MGDRLIHRRCFLVRTAGTAGAIASAGFLAPSFALAQSDTTTSGGKPSTIRKSDRKLPDYAEWKDADAMIVHSQNTIEMKREAFGTSGITPNDRVYVRNNLPPPQPVTDPDSWKVSVGGVKNPRDLTIGELKRRPRCSAETRAGAAAILCASLPM